MYYINYPELDQDITIQTMTFPGGEPHIKIDAIPDDSVFVTYTGTTWEDFGYLLVLLNAIYYQNKSITLAIPYFPGARQDRNPGGYTPLTVEIYADMLSPYVDYLIVVDIHSNKALDIIGNAIVNITDIAPYQIIDYFKHYFFDIDFVISPDKGAVSRASEVAAVLGVPLLLCDKERDFNTGHIYNYRIMGEVLPGNYLVIDDICDGGATFNLLAEYFFKEVERDPDKSKYNIDLYVTHPIFSKGFGELLSNYRHIYTTNSRDIYIDPERLSSITVLPLQELLRMEF